MKYVYTYIICIYIFHTSFSTSFSNHTVNTSDVATQPRLIPEASGPTTVMGLTYCGFDCNCITAIVQYVPLARVPFMLGQVLPYYHILQVLRIAECKGRFPHEGES